MFFLARHIPDLESSIVQRVAASCVVLAVIALCGASNAESRGLPVVVEIGTGHVDGKTILGRSVAEVTAAFGKPTWRTGGRQRFSLGYGDRENFRMLVRFHQAGKRVLAYSVSFERQPVRERRLGMNLLALTPRDFSRSVRDGYRADVKVVRPLRCVRGVCAVTFAAADDAYRFTFGRSVGPLGTYLTLWTAARE